MYEYAHVYVDVRVYIYMHVYIYANVDVCSYEYTLSPPFSIIRVITTVVITTIIIITLIIIHIIIIITPSSLSAYVVGIYIYIYGLCIYICGCAHTQTQTHTHAHTHTYIYTHRHNLSIYFPHIHAGFVPASEELSCLVFQGRPNTLALALLILFPTLAKHPAYNLAIVSSYSSRYASFPNFLGYRILGLGTEPYDKDPSI